MLAWLDRGSEIKIFSRRNIIVTTSIYITRYVIQFENSLSNLEIIQLVRTMYCDAKVDT